MEQLEQIILPRGVYEALVRAISLSAGPVPYGEVARLLIAAERAQIAAYENPPSPPEV